MSANLEILVIEDDARFAELLSTQLADFGHRVTVMPNVRAGLAAVTGQAFDAVILDRMLPGGDGIAVLEGFRSAGIDLPTLMLTSLGMTSDKVDGLTAGADDYCVKPIDPHELNARLKAMIRARSGNGHSSNTIKVAGIVISPTAMRAWRNGRDLQLQRTEFNLLLELARNAGSVLTRPMLIERVWGYDFQPGTNIVDAYIWRLRTKLTEFGGDPIVTVRGSGYMLRED
ncbi:MAG: response regulator [Porphyrobacter sp.]|nr:response regulator [Porphyrobacter sp.]